MRIAIRFLLHRPSRNIRRCYDLPRTLRNRSSFKSIRPFYTRLQAPALFRELADGTEEKISEEDLYRYTRHRWLCNEKQELSKRYLWFNLEELLKIAVQAAGNDARNCVKVLKCSEGLHNKAFLLTMDNGTEVFAKLPNSNAGPARYTTASEVATRSFLCEMFKIPVPKVLAWSSNPHNPVGAEYIIEEKVPGVRLGNVWYQWPREKKLKLISQVVSIEHSLTLVNFQRHGCIYYKEDLQGLTGDAPDLSITSSAPIAPEILERYTIGPITSPELWRSGRENMKLDRGPWRVPNEYAQAVGINEIAWIKSHATPRMNYYRSLNEPERPEDAISLLSQYLEMAHHAVPQEADGPSSMVLWHPDLHLNNVFVDPDTHDILHIVDWQTASVAPLFLQCGVPRMFRHHKAVREDWAVPERPENFDTLSVEEKNQVDADLESETMHKYYEAQVYKRAPLLWETLQQKALSILREPIWLVSGFWENRDLFFLRRSLISVAAHWDELSQELYQGNTPPCPVNFSEEELKIHAKEEENIDGVGHLLTLFRDQGVLPVDGMVEPQDYEKAKENSLKFKAIFVGLASNDEERELFSKLWPYQDPEH